MNRLGKNCVRFLLSLMLAGYVLLSTAGHAHAQGTDVTVTIDEMDTSAFPTVQVRVSVRDRNGVPIPDLTAEHFEIVEDLTASLPPTTVDTESNPRARVSLAIVIDMYSTLKGEPIEAAQQATNDLLTDLLDEPNDPDRAAFIGVRRGVSTKPTEIDETYEVPFTNDRNRLLNVINFLHERIETSGPGTPLYDAVIKAVRLTAATEPVGHRAVIVMTDGQDRESISTDSDTIQSALNERIPVFTVGLSNRRLNEQYLQRLADQTGGIYQAAETPDDFSPLFTNVLTMLHTQYVLTYESSLPEDGQEHRLVVHVRTPTQMKGFQDYSFQTPGTAPEEPVAQESTPAPQPSESTPPPEPEAAPQDLMSTLQDWVQENTLLAIAAVAAIGLLFLVLVIIVIIAIRRRGQAEEEMPPPLPEAPYPAAPPALGETGPELGMGVTDRGPGLPGVEPVGSGVAPTPSPTVAAGGPPAFGATPPPPFAGPGAPPPPPAGAGVQAPPAGGTQILERAPKMAQVGLLIDREHPDRRFDIAKPMVTIGRAQNSDVVLDHATVSRQHATIKLEEDQFRIYDLGSSNGTFVGEQRVREPVTIEDGAMVRFGKVAFIFKIVSLDT